MTYKEKCARRVIELIHGVEYEEAVKKEFKWFSGLRFNVSSVEFTNLAMPFGLSIYKDDIFEYMYDLDVNYEKAGDGGTVKAMKTRLTKEGRILGFNTLTIPRKYIHNIFPKITLSRVMQAFRKSDIAQKGYQMFFDIENNRIYDIRLDCEGWWDREFICDWKQDNGETATLEDQTEETAEKIYQLIKKDEKN